MIFSNVFKNILVATLVLVLFLPQSAFAFSISDITPTSEKYNIKMSDQSFCIADDTHTILEHNPDTLRFLASVSKLYITDWVLNVLPKDFRFQTKFIREGNTLTIRGDGDPQFISEHFLYAWYRITNESPVTITKIVFGSKFYFNWDYDAITIAKAIKLLIQKPNVAHGGRLADIRARLLYRDHTGIFPKKRQQTISNVSFRSEIQNTKSVTYVLNSPSLPHILKQMNMYSTNSIANLLFERAGGLNAFTNYMKTTFNTNEQNFAFTTGSGLAGNEATCRITIQMLKHLKQTTDMKGLPLGSVVAAPGQEGTLQNRLKNNPQKNAVLMKTGNVWEHVTLAGYIQTTSGFHYFTFLNRASLSDDIHVNQARRFQDEVLTQYLQTLPTKPFESTEDSYPWAHFTFQKK